MRPINASYFNMSRATSIGFLFIIFCLLLIESTVVQAARDNPLITTYEQAEYLISDSRTPPDNEEDWQPITLPDNWAVSRPGFKGRVWYRIRFEIPGFKRKGRAIYIPRNNADHYFVYINGIPRGGNRSYVDPNLTDLHRPLIYGKAGYPPGENVIHIRVTGDATYRHGLSRVTIGPPRLVRPQYYQPRYDLQVTSIAAFGTTLLLAGVLALLVWRGQRQPVMFWFSMVALAWAFTIYLMVWPPQVKSDATLHLLLYTARHLYIVPLLVLCMRIGNLQNRLLEGGLWTVFVMGAVVSMMLDEEKYIFFASTTWALYLLLSIGFTGWLVWQRFQADKNPEQQRNNEKTEGLLFRTRERSVYFLPITLLVIIFFMTHDWLRWLGYVDYDNLLLTPFAMPFLILALGSSIIASYLESARALARSNVELEQRVADKANELEQAYKQMQETQRKQTILNERQRIMGDMHDGLSANLVSLHNLAQMPGTDSTEIAQRIDETFQELQAIVDSLEPVEGDLGVVLGNIRYRMRAALETSGTKLIWQVEELPQLADLTPEKILNIQRIILEVFTNILRHADAQTVTVSARAETDRNCIVIEITDDGHGFDLTIIEGGRGLQNMRKRASNIGIKLNVQSQPDKGTIVTLELPIIG